MLRETILRTDMLLTAKKYFFSYKINETYLGLKQLDRLRVFL